MADRSDVSQFVPLVGADDAGAAVSQLVPLVGADDAAATVSQLAPLVGADDAGVLVSQFVLLVGRGPEVVPPTDTPAGTFTFDEGLGNDWFILLQLSDYGDELRDHVVKSFRLTGKVTNCRVQVYGQGALEDINVDDMVAGVNSKTGVIALPDTAQVQRSRRFPVNVKNVAASTIRIDGMWNGDGIRDSIHEIAIEAAQQGIRR